MGAEELSMAPAAIPSVKEKLRASDYSTLKELAEKVMSFSSHMDVFNYLKKNLE